MSKFFITINRGVLICAATVLAVNILYAKETQQAAILVPAAEYSLAPIYFKVYFATLKLHTSSLVLNGLHLFIGWVLSGQVGEIFQLPTLLFYLNVQQLLNKIAVYIMQENVQAMISQFNDLLLTDTIDWHSLETLLFRILSMLLHEMLTDQSVEPLLQHLRSNRAQVVQLLTCIIANFENQASLARTPSLN